MAAMVMHIRSFRSFAADAQRWPNEMVSTIGLFSECRTRASVATHLLEMFATSSTNAIVYYYLIKCALTIGLLTDCPTVLSLVSGTQPKFYLERNRCNHSHTHARARTRRENEEDYLVIKHMRRSYIAWNYTGQTYIMKSSPFTSCLSLGQTCPISVRTHA